MVIFTKIKDYDLVCVKKALKVLNNYGELIQKIPKTDDSLCGYSVYNLFLNKMQTFNEDDGTKQTLHIMLEHFIKSEASEDPNTTWIVEINKVCNEYFSSIDSKDWLKNLLKVNNNDRYGELIGFLLVYFIKSNKKPLEGYDYVWFLNKFGLMISDYVLDEFDIMKYLKETGDKNKTVSNLKYILWLLQNEFYLDPLKPQNVEKLISRFPSDCPVWLIHHINFKILSQSYAFDQNKKHETMLVTKINTMINNVNKTKIFNLLSEDYIKVTNNFIDHLLSKSSLISFNTVQLKSNKRATKLDLNQLTFDYLFDLKLPPIYKDKILSNSELLDVTVNYFSADQQKPIVLRCNNDLIHPKYYLDSWVKPKGVDFLIKMKQNNPYHINQSMLLTLLTNLNELHETKNLVLLTELYKIDFVGFESSMAKLDFELLKHYAIDLNNLSKFDTTKNDKQFLLLTDKIYSYKLAINNTLFQAILMSVFPYYYYEFFFDARNRHYIINGALNPQGSDLCRSVVSFYFTKKIKWSTKAKSLYCDQIKSIRPDYDEKYNSFSECLKLNNVKKFELFNYYLMQSDYHNETNFKFNYGLDATGSGMQMYCIMLRNRNLGEQCSLLKSQDENSAYDKVINFLKSKLFFDITKYKSFYYIPFDPSAKNLAKEKKKFIENKSKTLNPRKYDQWDDFKALKLDFKESEWLLSGKALEFINCNLREEKSNIILNQMKIFETKLNKIQGLRDFLKDRKAVKKPIMTIPYGSTSFGRISQMTEGFMDYCNANGIIYDDNNKFLLQFILTKIDKLLILWCDNNIPELFYLIDLCRHDPEALTLNQTENEYFGFKYTKRKSVKAIKRIGRYNTRLKKRDRVSFGYYQDEYDFKAIVNAWPANQAQFMDATLACNILTDLMKLGIPCCGIHDCFRVHPVFSDKLREVIIKNYLKSFNINWFNNGFKSILNPNEDLDYNEFSSRLNHFKFFKH